MEKSRKMVQKDKKKRKNLKLYSKKTRWATISISAIYWEIDRRFFTPEKDQKIRILTLKKEPRKEPVKGFDCDSV